MKRTIRSLIAILTAWTVCLFGGSTVLSLSPENDVYLAETPDAGMEYQNLLVFFGESTTAHLANRGVLSGGKETDQVFANASGTCLLSPKIGSQTVRDPKCGKDMPLTELIAKARPAYLVLSFGLNGIVGFSKNHDTYLQSYQKLIDAVQSASPSTAIILQTVYPVSAPTDGSKWHFSQSAKEINQMICDLNSCLPTLAAANTGVKIADTASVLRAADGSLDPAFSSGDGIHLNANAYTQILRYLRTHAYHTPMPLPISPDQWRNQT